MVTVVSGKLGSGKSLDMVRMMRDHLAAGGVVVTNISLDSKQISRAVRRRVSGLQILHVSGTSDPKLIPTGDRRGHGHRRTMVVLDEALNWFQSETGRSEDKTKKAEWGEWLRQSDKLGQDVYFIAQNFERAAKWIRELAQRAREIIPLRDVRLLWVLPLRFLFPPARSMYAVNVWDVRSKTRAGLEFHRYTPSVWSLYDTSETFGFVGAASAYDRFSLWPAYRPPVAPLFICVALLGVSVVSLVWGFVR